MLKIQSVNHVSEHLSAIYPVYTFGGGSVNVVNGGEGWVIPYVTQHTNAHQDMNTRGRLILWYQMFLGFFRDIRMLTHVA